MICARLVYGYASTKSVDSTISRVVSVIKYSWLLLSQKYLFQSILPIPARSKRYKAKSASKRVHPRMSPTIRKWMIEIPRRRERCIAWKQRQGHPVGRDGGVKKEPRRHSRVCLARYKFLFSHIRRLLIRWFCLALHKRALTCKLPCWRVCICVRSIISYQVIWWLNGDQQSLAVVVVLEPLLSTWNLRDRRYLRWFRSLSSSMSAGLSLWKWIARIPRRREEYVAYKQRQGHPHSRIDGVKKEPRRHPRVCLVGTTFFSLTTGNNSCSATRSFTRWQQAVLVFHHILTFHDALPLSPSSSSNLTEASLTPLFSHKTHTTMSGRRNGNRIRGPSVAPHTFFSHPKTNHA
jgi:hypothetical protein